MSRTGGSATSLKTTLELVGSDKIKERSQGLLLLREIFKDDGNCERLAMAAAHEGDSRGGGGGGDRGSWLYVLQAVFGCVGVERAAAIKAMGGGAGGAKTGQEVSSSTTTTTTTTAAALRTANARLQDAASLTRWLIDRAIPYMTKRTVVTVCAHLVQSMIHRGRLLSPIALDYIRALKALVSDQAHLDHLDEQAWKRLMAVCLDALTGRELSFQHDDWEEEAEVLEEEAAVAAEQDASARPAKRRRIIDSDDEDEEILVEPPSSTSMTPRASQRLAAPPSSALRVRGTQATQSTNRRSTSTDPSQGSMATMLTPEIIELASIVPILLTAAQAPILPPPRPADRPVGSGGNRNVPNRGGCGLAILVRCAEFLSAHRAETSCHRSVVAAIMAVLRDVELNYPRQVAAIASKLFPRLVDLWGTRDEELRDWLLMAYRILLPFLRQGGPVPGGSHKISSISLAALSCLVENLPRDAGVKRGLVPLDMSLLTLRLNVDGRAVGPDNPFSTAVMLAAPEMTPAMATTWLALEVQADSIIELHRHFQLQPNAAPSGASSTPSFPPTATAGRIRKTVGDRVAPTTPERDPILLLLENISSTRSDVRLLHLQSLLFLIDRHWTCLHTQLQRDIRDDLLRLTADADPSCQQWSLVALTCILARSDDAPDDIWAGVWQMVSRKTGLSAGASSRAACLLGELLLNRCDKSVTGDAIEAILRDVHVQGPAVLYDAVCSFYAKALSMSARDARFFRANFADAALTWLERSWQANAGRRARSTTVEHAVNSAPQFFQLVQEISGTAIEGAAHAEFPSLCTDHSVTRFMQTRLREQALRDYLFAAKVPMVHSANPSDAPPILKPDLARINRLCAILRTPRADFDIELGSFSAAILRCDLSFAAVSIFCQGSLLRTFDGVATASETIDREPFVEICRDLAQILDRALHQNLSPTDLAFVLGGLRPILGVDDLSLLGHKSEISSILQPGPLSGVVNIPVLSLAEQLEPRDRPSKSMIAHLGLLWENEEASLLDIPR